MFSRGEDEQINQVWWNELKASYEVHGSSQNSTVTTVNTVTHKVRPDHDLGD